MFKRNLVSVSIASILLTSSIAASANTGSSEEEDSVGSWGQWAQNYATAAGGELNGGALAFALLSQRETGRNQLNEAGFDLPADPIDPVIPIDPVVSVDPVATIGCDAGSFCGFATIGPGVMMPTDSAPRDTDVGIVSASMEMAVIPDRAGRARVQREGSYIPIVGSFGIEGNEGYELSVDGAEGSISGGSLNLGKWSKDSSQYLTLYRSRDAAVKSGYWYDENYTDFSSTGGNAFGGITTSLDQLNDYIGNHGVTASYIGSTLDNTRIAVDLNFENKTWAATVGAGRDLKGKTGFSVAGGKIDGINFSAASSNLSATDGTVKGSVNGAIFGSKAQGVAGMIDVSKTTDKYTDKQYETIFSGTNTKAIPR
jgi:hypothetical protein